MSNKEKIENAIAENEMLHGAEIRKKFGDIAVDESNLHLRNLTPEQYEEGERLRTALEDALKSAMETKDPAGEAAQMACDLHRQWLSVFYEGYTKEYHQSLAEMYVSDDRFRANYDKISPGCTDFLRDAVRIYCS